MIHIAESGKGQPIILLHGFCENHHIWDSLASQLATQFRVLGVDLPGFGDSPLLPEKYTSLDDVADALAEELTYRKVGPAFVVGHSLGGYVALALAELYPELLQGIALVNSTTFGDSQDKKRTRDKVITFIAKHGVVPFINQFVEGIFYQKENFHEPYETVKAMGLSCSEEILIRYTAMMRDRIDRTFLLQQSTIPAMVIAGAEDSIVLVGQSQEMIDCLPEAHGTMLHSCGHMAMYEQPEKLYGHLVDFINNTATGGSRG
ncbi:MAG: alpha/beta hydrolase [Cyclobacteriaceae bacterium]